MILKLVTYTSVELLMLHSPLHLRDLVLSPSDKVEKRVKLISELLIFLTLNFKEISEFVVEQQVRNRQILTMSPLSYTCLLYTSDAADE